MADRVRRSASRPDCAKVLLYGARPPVTRPILPGADLLATAGYYTPYG